MCPVGRKHFGAGFHSSEEPVGRFVDLQYLLIAHLIIDLAAGTQWSRSLTIAQGRNNGYVRTYL